MGRDVLLEYVDALEFSGRGECDHAVVPQHLEEELPVIAGRVALNGGDETPPLR